MQIFKFGGASLKDPAGVKNVAQILEKSESIPKVLVISAMGKTTNALEVVVQDYLDAGDFKSSLSLIKDFHFDMIFSLFRDGSSAQKKLQVLFDELENFLDFNRSRQYDYVYDQVVVYGELLSSTILSQYLEQKNLQHQWVDARNLIKTDSTFREAKVNWEKTQQHIVSKISKSGISITQGFIGADDHNFSSTLGREGSDYTAAIFAFCLNAESVTIWKDVPGVLNADPRYFEKCTLLEHISYEEAIELAFYGASVIHPKTLQPLQRKEIPLHVRSFLNPKAIGTQVKKGQALVPQIPCFIVKKDQILISLSSLDFSFIIEENISQIFKLFHKHQIKVDLIQNSAISFSVCVHAKFSNLERLLFDLKANYKVSYNTGVSLYTVRHFDDAALKELEAGKSILLKQITRETLQIVTSA